MGLFARQLSGFLLIFMVVFTTFELGQSAPTLDSVFIRNCNGCSFVGTQCCTKLNGGKALPKGTNVTPICVTRGEVINGDPYWVFSYVPSLGISGYIADYYIDCGGEICAELC